jgi:hypothetical protein
MKTMTTMNTMKTVPNCILTRFLYHKNQLKISLVWACLDKDVDEALFWAYELYYSGFKAEVWALMRRIYRWLYQELHPSWGGYLEYHATNDHEETALGTLIQNMVPATISLTHIQRLNMGLVGAKRHKMDLTDRLPSSWKLFDQDRLKRYHFPADADIRTYRLLSHVCQYSVRTCTAELVMKITDTTMDDMFHLFETPEALRNYTNDWIYPASFSPVWQDLLAEYGGKICHTTHTVLFDDEDREEEFWIDYNYEPDEQPREIQQRIMLKAPPTLVPWEEIWEKYGQDSVYRHIKITRKPG